jgi:hypothetical protein
MEKFQTHPVLDKKKIWKCYVWTEEKLDNTGAWVETSPQEIFVSVRQLKWSVKILSSQVNGTFKTTSTQN